MQHPVSDGTTTPFKSISNVNFGFQSNGITCHEKDQQMRSHEAFRSNPGNPAATCSIWAWRPLWPCMSSSCERNLRICLKEPGPSKYPWEMLFYPQMFSLVGGFNHLEKHESQLGWLFPIYGSQLGFLFPVYGKIKNVPNHQPDKNAVLPPNAFGTTIFGVVFLELLKWQECTMHYGCAASKDKPNIRSESMGMSQMDRNGMIQFVKTHTLAC